MIKSVEIETPEERILGVIIVSYCSGDFLLDCLERLLSSDSITLKIVVCDNASSDDTVTRLRAWANGKIKHDLCAVGPLKDTVRSQKPIKFSEYSAREGQSLRLDQFSDVTLLNLDCNMGFAGGVNVGISALFRHPEVDLFWILNPDCIVLPNTAAEFRRHATSAKTFGLMGGRLIYTESPNLIQSDGGVLNVWTGVCKNINQGMSPDTAIQPNPSDLDFISGANVVASRAFIEMVGPMTEDYFIYYEEVDWAARRGDMNIIWCEDAIVYHHGGTVIGTGAVNRVPSAFANYFNYRNRVRFMKEFHADKLIFVATFSFLKIIQLLTRGAWSSAVGAMRGMFGLAPSREIADRIGDDSARVAFGKETP